MKHTNGPWEVIENQVEALSEGKQNRFIVEVGMPSCKKSKVDFANARLISAAPDLLEACKIVLENLKPKYSSYHVCIKSLEQAIQKAEGGQDESSGD